MRILVTGAGGMLGHALVPVLETDHQVIGLTRKNCDLLEEGVVRKIFQFKKPDMVIHLAAFTNVDGCELEPNKAIEENAMTTLSVAKAAKSVGASLVYISTDYVFDGRSGRPYREDDPPNPLSIYGRTKLIGENHVQGILDRYFIVRTSWLFGPHGKNFVSTILRLASEEPEIRVVNEQQGSPTYTCHLAQKLAELLKTDQYGVYHVTGSGSCSWFDFARKIVELGGFRGVQVTPISTREYVRPAPRPAYSVLANQRIASLGMGLLPHWEKGLESYLAEIREEKSDGDGAIGKESACSNHV